MLVCFLILCGVCCAVCIALLHFLNQSNHCTPYLSGVQNEVGQISAVQLSGIDRNTDLSLAQEESVCQSRICYETVHVIGKR